MKRIFTILCALALVMAGSATALAAEPEAGQSASYYPVSVEEYTYGDFDELRINKTYQLSLADDPSLIPTEDFIRNGRRYSALPGRYREDSSPIPLCFPSLRARCPPNAPGAARKKYAASRPGLCTLSLPCLPASPLLPFLCPPFHKNNSRISVFRLSNLILQLANWRVGARPLDKWAARHYNREVA